MTASASASATVPGRPVLLTSLASAILADGQGDIRLTLESRGAPSEWGGVYGELVRLTGPWTVELASGDAGSDLPSCRVDAPAMAGGWRSRHRWHGLEIVQDVAATADPAGAVRRLTFRSESPAPVRVTVTSRFPPFLFPVLVEGIRPREFELRTSAEDILIRHQGFALRFASTVLPSRLFLNHGSWIGGTYRGRVDEFASEHELVVPPMGAAEVRWQVVGGLARDLEAAVKRRGRVIPSPEEVTAAQVRDEQVWIDSTPDLGFPDAPELEAAYRDARSAIRRLYSAPGPEMVGLVAGYPWYSSIWCRDLAVMLPALLWLGDFDWVEQSLATVFRFQSHQTIPLLAAEPGELPMQIAPGPLFLYGTSDSTLRFAPVVEQLHRHCGGLGAVDRWAEAVHRIVEWGRRRSDPATGLLRHGGEAESIAVATGHLARVQYGIDSPDTTIWDSADRRDHAIDVQVLWWQTLDSTARMLGHVADHDRGSSCEELADRLATTVRERYSWPAEHYLYDSLRSGNPVARVRPNALRAVSAGLVDAASAVAIVDRAAQDDLTTPWGVRSLSSRDPTYDPHTYHEGQVWTIATAWAADAAFAVGQPERAVEYLRTISARYASEGGYGHECYRGDRGEPYNSCFLLGFSVAPFLAVLFERLWGIRIGPGESDLRVVPAFPRGWSSARLRGLRLSGGKLDLEWAPGGLSVRWSGPGTLSVDTGAGIHAVPPGAPTRLAVPSPPEL